MARLRGLVHYPVRHSSVNNVGVVPTFRAWGEDFRKRKEQLMSKRLLPLLVVAVALALLVGAPLLAADKEKKANQHEGTVVSVTEEKLIMKAKGDDAKEHEHTLAADAKVTCDGKECKLADLKAGQKVRVTTKKGDKKVAIRVEALDKNDDFERSKD
jgi:hypothetical protein